MGKKNGKSMEKINYILDSLTELDLLIHKVQSIRISKTKHDIKTQKLEDEKQRLINSNGMVKR